MHMEGDIYTSVKDKLERGNRRIGSVHSRVEKRLGGNEPHIDRPPYAGRGRRGARVPRGPRVGEPPEDPRAPHEGGRPPRGPRDETQTPPPGRGQAAHGAVRVGFRGPERDDPRERAAADRVPPEQSGSGSPRETRRAHAGVWGGDA